MTVFERDDRIGGLLRYGIPDFKMPKDIIDRRVEQMAAEGTVFRTERRRSVAAQVEALRSEFDAVILAVGALAPRELSNAGRELRGRAPGDGVPAAGQPGTGRRHRRPGDRRRGQERDHHRWRRHGRRLPGHRQPAGRGLGDRPGPQPAPGAARRPGEPGLAVGTQQPRALPRPRRRRSRGLGARGRGVPRRRERARPARSWSRRSRSSGSTAGASSARSTGR